MNFITRHWILCGLIALFFYGIYTVSTSMAKIAAVALAALFFWVELPLLFLLIPIYALGYAFGFLPASLYDWIPRKGGATSLTTAIVQPESTP